MDVQLTALLVDTDVLKLLEACLNGIPVYGFSETWLTAVETRTPEVVSDNTGLGVNTKNRDSH